MTEPVESNHEVWASRGKLVFGLFAVVGMFFLLVEHRAHVLPFLPWLFLAACPLMHLFMHGGHGHGHGHQHDSKSDPSAPNRELPAVRTATGHEHQGGRS